MQMPTKGMQVGFTSNFYFAYFHKKQKQNKAKKPQNVYNNTVNGITQSAANP